jgi:hypothetical protein
MMMMIFYTVFEVAVLYNILRQNSAGPFTKEHARRHEKDLLGFARGFVPFHFAAWQRCTFLSTVFQKSASATNLFLYL